MSCRDNERRLKQFIIIKIRKMKTRIITVLVWVILFMPNIYAQKSDSILVSKTDSIAMPKAQATIIYPWGTNGEASMKKANNVSFNLFYGVNGGLDGAELGGIGNHNLGDVKGAQFAGVSNITKGKTTGAAFATAVNVSSDSVRGALFSGGVNYYQHSLNGAVFAPVNVGVGNAKGAQFGVVNVQSKRVDGAQVGVVNYATNVSGSQIGVVNTSDSISSSFQLGVVNYATKASGSQLGVVNVVGNDDGVVPIGLFSVVGNGYFGLELSTSEIYHTTLQYKMGVDAFYNIFSVGLLDYSNLSQYSVGYGVGTQKRLGKHHLLGIELVGHQIVEDNEWDVVNVLGQINLDYTFLITQNIGITFGPSINGYYTELNNGGQWGNIDMPYDPVLEHEFDRGKLFGWIGLNAGLTIRF